MTKFFFFEPFWYLGFGVFYSMVSCTTRRQVLQTSRQQISVQPLGTLASQFIDTQWNCGRPRFLAARDRIAVQLQNHRIVVAVFGVATGLSLPTRCSSALLSCHTFVRRSCAYVSVEQVSQVLIFFLNSIMECRSLDLDNDPLLWK